MRLLRRAVAALALALCHCASSSSSPPPAAPPPTTTSATSGIYRLTPVRPVEELRREALAATPPARQESETATPDLVELVTLEPTIRLDIRYATTNNFLSSALYEEGRAFLQRPAAEALVRAHRELAKQGYGILVHDAYRPWYVTKLFWDATPPDKHDFVANPAHGSRHNRGCAADVTLYALATGQAVSMPSLYDEMSERARADYPGGTDEQRRLRQVLRSAMEAQDFAVYDVEWWHFDFKDWKLYPLGNQPFDKIAK